MNKNIVYIWNVKALKLVEVDFDTTTVSYWSDNYDSDPLVVLEKECQKIYEQINEHNKKIAELRQTLDVVEKELVSRMPEGSL